MNNEDLFYCNLYIGKDGDVDTFPCFVEIRDNNLLYIQSENLNSLLNKSENSEGVEIHGEACPDEDHWEIHVMVKDPHDMNSVMSIIDRGENWAEIKILEYQ